MISHSRQRDSLTRGIFSWVTEKSVRKEERLLLGFLNQLRQELGALHPQIAGIGREHASARTAIDRVVGLRDAFYDQISIGPMSPSEVQEFLAPHLREAPEDCVRVVGAILDRVERDYPL